MATYTPGVRSGLNALMQEHLSTKVVQNLFKRMPLLYFLLGKDGDKKGIYGLGRPSVNGQGGILLTGVSAAKARKEAIMGSLIYQPLIQYQGPAAGDGKPITSLTDTNSYRNDWANTSPSSYVKRPTFKWHIRQDPYKIPTTEARMTRAAAANETAAWKAIGSLATLETESVVNTHTKVINDLIWGVAVTGYAATGYPSLPDADLWNNLYSIRAALDYSVVNEYAGIDRSVAANSWWRGNAVTSATTADFETLINYANYDTSMADYGLAVDIILVGNTLFKKAKAEAKAKGGSVHYVGAIPEIGEFGFKKECVMIDNVWIVNDPTCPSGHGAALNLSSWTFAIHPDANFTVSEPFDQGKVEGGDRALTGNVETQLMLACEWPAANCYWTSLS